MGGRSSFPMQTVPVGRRQALLHKHSMPPQGLLRRPRSRQRAFQPTMIHHAIDEALLLLTPSCIWRRTHHYHHSHNGCLQTAGIGSFPVMTTRAFARASRRQRFLYAPSRHPLTILAGSGTVFLYGMCLRPRLSWGTKVQATPRTGTVLAVVETRGFFVFCQPRGPCPRHVKTGRHPLWKRGSVRSRLGRRTDRTSLAPTRQFTPPARLIGRRK
jgi:hypothetical protein